MFATEELGLDELDARVLRVETYERKGSIGRVLQKWSVLARHADPMVRHTALLSRGHSSRLATWIKPWMT